MRDFLLLVCFPIFVYYGIRSPYLALCCWVWTSLYPIQNWAWGVALSLRYNLVFALITIVGYLITLKNKPSFESNALFVLVFVFYLQCFLGVFLNAPFAYQWGDFTNLTKVLVLFVLMCLMLREKWHFEAVITFIALSLGMMGLGEGLKFLLTGGAHGIRGIAGPFGDNNKIALGLNMIIPLLIFLIGQSKEHYKKLLFKAIVLGCVLGVISANSRGGTIALGVLACYYWWISGKKIAYPLIICIAAIIALNFMPDGWLDRMSSIQNASTDNSFIHRLTSWKLSYLIALEYPFLGLSFDSVANKVVWLGYVNELDSVNWFIHTPIPDKGFVAHSIYFEVLGNQGFIGLLLFLFMLRVGYTKTKYIIKQINDENDWRHKLANSLRASLVAFCVGGALLNAAYNELLFMLLAFIISVEMACKTKVMSK